MRFFRVVLRGSRKVVAAPAFHAAIHAALATTIAGLFVLSAGENRAYNTIVTHTTADTMSQREKAISLLHTAHDLVYTRNEYLPRVQDPGLRAKWLHSGDLQLMTGGACGSYTHVLARLLDQAGFQYRVMQMLCEPNMKGACHVLLEAKINEKWVVFDPLYDLYYQPPSGQLASFEQIRYNWSYYKEQAPSNYNFDLYTYDGRRYTNWQKIPIVMPLIKSFLDEIGFNKVSIRSHVLNIYKTYGFLLVAIQFIAIVFTISTFKKRR